MSHEEDTTLVDPELTLDGERLLSTDDVRIELEHEAVEGLLRGCRERGVEPSEEDLESAREIVREEVFRMSREEEDTTKTAPRSASVTLTPTDRIDLRSLTEILRTAGKGHAAGILSDITDRVYAAAAVDAAGTEGGRMSVPLTASHLRRLLVAISPKMEEGNLEGAAVQLMGMLGDGMAKGKGRPTDCTPEMQARIVLLIEEGNYDYIAARLAGTSDTSFYSWKARGEKGEQPFADFLAAVKEAESKNESNVIARMMKVGDDDWKCQMTFLERKHPERWGKKDRVTVEVKSAAAGMFLEVIALANDWTPPRQDDGDRMPFSEELVALFEHAQGETR